MNLNDLPAQFPKRTWEQESLTAVRRISSKGLDGQAMILALKDARLHFERTGSLDGWDAQRNALSNRLAEIEKQARQARTEAIKASGFKPRYATLAEVTHVLTRAHDACTDEVRPAAAALLREAGVPAKDATRLAGKHSIHQAKVWDSLDDHPARAAMREHKVMTRRKARAANGNSLAGSVASLYSLADHMQDRQRLSAVEQEQTAMKAEIAALKAQLAGINARHALEDAGIDPKVEAVRLRGEGKSIGAIALELNRSKSTIHGWLA